MRLDDQVAYFLQLQLRQLDGGGKNFEIFVGTLLNQMFWTQSSGNLISNPSKN